MDAAAVLGTHLSTRGTRAHIPTSTEIAEADKVRTCGGGGRK